MQIKVEMVLAALFAVLAGVIWLVMLRPVERRTAAGIIATKTFQPASTYSQYQGGADRGFRGSNQIPIAESYVFDIKVEGMAEPVRMSLNTVASKEFEVGQRVRIEYEQRGVPPFWQKAYALEMKTAE
ncbi:MAG: hypothetical protein M3R15_12795 [Acidobacteriota bacterium]|nr:hypothetical protein [Acidobacteriota bacterium]